MLALNFEKVSYPSNGLYGCLLGYARNAYFLRNFLAMPGTLIFKGYSALSSRSDPSCSKEKLPKQLARNILQIQFLPSAFFSFVIMVCVESLLFLISYISTDRNFMSLIFMFICVHGFFQCLFFPVIYILSWKESTLYFPTIRRIGLLSLQK